MKQLMKFSFEYKKKNIYSLCIAAVVSIILSIMSGMAWWIIPLFLAAFFGILSTRIELKDDLPWVWTTFLYALGVIGSVFLIQYMLLDSEDFQKTSDPMYIANFALVAAIAFLALFLTTRPIMSIRIAYIFTISMGVTDYFIYEFRGNEFSYSDLKSIGTGLSVAANYKFEINEKVAYVILISILFVALTTRFKYQYKSKFYLRLISILLVVIGALLVRYNTIDANTETWQLKGTYRNGFMVNFYLGIRDSFVSKPDDYSLDRINELEEAYSDDDSTSQSQDGKKPTIIVIMNESFSDLRKVGDFQTNVEVTPFLDSLKTNTLRGYALSSVYGAKTPNSEWEYMTGNSMAFLPKGSVVYQQYISDNPYSLVTTLKNYGYTCVAMHPYYETGWSRNKVYPNMGFDETHFIDDFDQNNIIREYITDQELYNKIIDRYEEKSDDESLYIMGITMQNHGGYGEDYDNFKEEVHKTGYSYTDGNQYLSLIHESDKAIRNLITYFSKQEEPVEIVFFGDHQPGLCSPFLQLLNGKGKEGLSLEEIQNLYTVPFFIWTNYDTESQEVDITSLNQLSTMTLERAGLELPAYNRFLKDFYQVIPAINANGFYSKETNSYKEFDQASDEEAKWIDNYNILEYNSMFDQKNRSQLFFPYID